jgi:DNA-directed RNA polymerase subunit M/transcription elongation factor TFIIS
MKFCTTCDNMMYITTEAVPSTDVNATQAAKLNLVYHCKCCNNRITSEEKSVIIMEQQYRNDTTSYKQFISPFIKHDPTLPRVNNIACIHDDCSGKDKTSETIYIKYDNANMKYIYYCCHCTRYWKAD